MLKDKGDSNYQANTNKLKAILNKGFGTLKEILDEYHLRPYYLKIKKLILSGSDVNIQDKDGYTVLILAARDGFRDIIELLIATGAGVNIKNDTNRNALMLAASNGHKDIVKLLIASGAIE